MFVRVIFIDLIFLERVLSLMITESTSSVDQGGMMVICRFFAFMNLAGRSLCVACQLRILAERSFGSGSAINILFIRLYSSYDQKKTEAICGDKDI